MLAAIIPVLSLLTDLLSHQTFASISISAYYTRAPTSDNALDYLSQLGLPAHLSLSPGRPPLAKNLSNVVDRACLPNSRDGRMLYGVEDERCGVIVGVCGPSGLAQQVRQVVGHADPKMRKNVGGIEVHVE